MKMSLVTPLLQEFDKLHEEGGQHEDELRKYCAMRP